MSRFGRFPLRAWGSHFFKFLLAWLATSSLSSVDAQNSLFDPAFGEVRRASVAWDNRTGPDREVVDLVCLVPDVPTFLEAVSAWDERRYFPILIDDVQYTLPFLRAFRPSRIVRYGGKSEGASGDALWEKAVSTVGRAWSTDGIADKDVAHGDSIPKALGPTPPGVVLSHPESPCLAGAVALAAGRFQPLLRWSTTKKFGEKLSLDEASDAALSLETLLAERGIKYDELGDDCDFVTLAGDYPYRYSGRGRPKLNERPGEPAAFDDLILRSSETTRRWGFAGRLLGDSTASVYQAMCSLFLHPKSALLFNTYEDKSQPWSGYVMSSVAGQLGSQINVSQRFGERASLSGWHQVFDPFNKFGLAMINTSGGGTSYNIAGGPGNTADIPEGSPSAILMIHSFSAEAPEDPDTLAGRWLANGAFIYYGAMYEPYLVAFRPPSLVATFLSQNLPLVTAARRSGSEPFGEAWRLMFIGDPLYRLKPHGKLEGRRIEPTGLEGWLSYSEFHQPAPDATEAMRLNWALKTAIFRYQTGTPIRQKVDLADALLAISRDRIDPERRSLYDDLLVDTLTHANRTTELRDRLAKIPVSDRSPSVRRHLETAQMAALQHAIVDKDPRIALTLWQDVIRARGSRDFCKTFTERVGKLAESAGRTKDWRTLLEAAIANPPEPANKPIIEAEWKRIDPEPVTR